MLLSRFGGSSGKTYIDDVFSTWLYKGNSSTQSIANGNDLAGKGGSVHIKGRSGTQGTASHRVAFTALGAGNFLRTDSNLGLASETGITAFGASGFSLGAAPGVNDSGTEYVAWSFVDADKFHGHAVVIKSAGNNATVSFPGLGTLGMVRVKRTDAAGSWYVWHRSLSAGQLLIGETTAAAATLGHVTVSGTTVTLVNGVIADGTYLVEAWAHDTSPDGIIQCGSFTSNGDYPQVTLGWETQFLLIKRTDSATDGNWMLADAMRPDFTVRASAGDVDTKVLLANTSGAEAGTTLYVGPNATGFKGYYGAGSRSFIYLAIRRPNKPPTTGTQVYNAIARTGTGAEATVTGVGFAPDFGIVQARNTAGWGVVAQSRMTGNEKLFTSSTGGSAANTWGRISKWEPQEGVTLEAGSSGFQDVNGAAITYINHFFRRAPGVHDHLPYNGSGSNKTESPTLLGVPPELWLAKRRNGTGSWVYGSSLLNSNEKIVMPSPNGRVTDATVWNSTYPTASQISLGTSADVNAAGGTYILYMWATLAGISKVGKYTGNGTSQNIECGFSSGARYVKIIRMTAGVAQDIHVWDTVRGIVAANDPHLSLNTTAAEVTTDDSLDPYAGGFAVNQNAATNINVNGAEYLFLAYA